MGSDFYQEGCVSYTALLVQIWGSIYSRCMQLQTCSELSARRAPYQVYSTKRPPARY